MVTVGVGLGADSEGVVLGAESELVGTELEGVSSGCLAVAMARSKAVTVAASMVPVGLTPRSV